MTQAGLESSNDERYVFGADTLHRKYAFKLREGFDPATMRILKRIMETPSRAGPFDEELLRKVIALYNAKV